MINNMKNSNSRIEIYESRCIEELAGFLECSFLKYDPYNMEDASIILDADARSRDWPHKEQSYLSQTAHFCGLWVIDGAASKLYEPDRYVEVLQLHPLNYKASDRIEIPFNHFQYPMMLDKGLGESFDEKLARYACNYDDCHDPYEILFGNNRLFIYDYYLGGITKFGQRRNVYRLSSFTKETLTDVLRREILKAQSVAIQYASRYPEYCRPDCTDLHISNRDAAAIMRSVCNNMESFIRQRSEEISLRLEDARVNYEKI